MGISLEFPIYGIAIVSSLLANIGIFLYTKTSEDRLVISINTRRIGFYILLSSLISTFFAVLSGVFNNIYIGMMAIGLIIAAISVAIIAFIIVEVLLI